jgi:hypothetical protein
MYVAWTALDPSSSRAHVYLSIGSSNGEQWSTPVAVESDASPVKTDKFFPWVAVDPISGHVGVTFYDSRVDTSNRLCDLFLATSLDSGLTFQDERISTRSMDPTVGRASRSVQGWDFKFFGDYIGLAGNDGVWRPAWCDSREGDDLEIFTAAVHEAGRGVPPAVQQVDGLTVRVIAGGDALLVESDVTGSVLITVTDILGRECAKLTGCLSGTAEFRLDALHARSIPLFYRVQVTGPERVIRTGRLR